MADDRLKLSRNVQIREIDRPSKPAFKPAEIEFPRPAAADVAKVKESLLRDLPSKETARGSAQDTPKETQRELSKDVPKDTPREPAKELVKETPKQPAQTTEERKRPDQIREPPKPPAPQATLERASEPLPPKHDSATAHHDAPEHASRQDSLQGQPTRPESSREERQQRREARQAARAERREMKQAFAELVQAHKAAEESSKGADAKMARVLDPAEAGHIEPSPQEKGHAAEHAPTSEGRPQSAQGKAFIREEVGKAALAEQPHLEPGHVEHHVAETPHAEAHQPEGLAHEVFHEEAHAQPDASPKNAPRPDVANRLPTPGKAEGTPGQDKPGGQPGEAAAHAPEAPQQLGPQPRPLSKLLPDLKKLTVPEEVPNRFLKDVVAARNPLLEGGMPKEQRASRLFGFFAHYAERFVTLAKGLPDSGQSWGPAPTTAEGNLAGQPTAPQMLKAQKESAVEQFLSNLKEVGFSQLKDKVSGNTGLQTAKQMLEAESPRDVQRQARETALVVVGGSASSAPSKHGESAQGQPQFNPEGSVINGRQNVPNDWEEEQLRRRHKSKRRVLGSNMLWNILHLERRANETMTKDELNRLAFGAILVLVGVTLMVVIIVNLK
jgi:hypothetical protein